MKWINLIPTSYKLIGLALALVALFTIYNIHKQSLIQKGKDIELAICNEGKLETINENLRIREKTNQVKRLPSDDAYIKRLHEGSI